MSGSKIQLRLLGPFAATAGADDITGTFAHPKRLAFVTWLALSRPAGLHRRETICALLWPESSDQHARGTLRQLLLVLRRELGEQAFVTEGELLGLNPAVVSSDAGAVFDALERGDDAHAVALYHGELLPGLHLGEGEAFERWFEQRREELRRGVARAAWRLVDGAEAGGDVAESLRLGEAAFALEPADEAGLRRLVELQAKAGDRAAALRTYEAFTRHLREDWNTEPDPQTVALIERIRTGRTNGGAGPFTPAAHHSAPPPVLAVPATEGPTQPTPPEVTVHLPEASPASGLRRRVSSATLVIAVLLIAAGVWAGSAWSARRSKERLERWSVPLPDSAPLVFLGKASLGSELPSLAVSPDARHVVYAGRHGSGVSLYVHEVGSFEIRLLPGTEGAFHPFFSPDSREVAYFAGGRLKKIAVAGGAATILADVVEPSGGVWTESNVFVIADHEGRRLSTIPATGGALESLRLTHIGTPIRVPVSIPGSSWLLHAIFSNTGILGVTSTKTGETLYLRRRGLPTRSESDPDILHGTRPLYVDGYLVYIAPNEGRLLARRFDARTLEVKGDAFPVLQGIRVEMGGAQTATGGGALAFANGGDARTGRLVWGSEGGRLDTLPIPPAAFGQFDLSPAGDRLVFTVATTDGPSEVQILDLNDLSRGPQERWRLPFGVVRPKWAPDGRWVALSVATRSKRSLYRAALPLGSLVDTLSNNFVVETFTPDGQSFVGVVFDTVGTDLARLPVTGGSATRLLTRTGNQFFASLSTDGTHLAYTSDESGSWEIYAERFPEMTRRRKVSIAGGDEPLWSPRGDRLYYRYGKVTFVARVNQQTGEVGTPVEFITGPFVNLPGYSYAVAPDGERLLLVLGPSDETANHIRIIRDFGAEIRRAEARK